jgi:excisionase family DNA binding protein
MLQIITNREEFKGVALEMMQWAVENMPVTNSTPEPEIMTGEELCKKLGVTIQTLIRWRHKGKIPFLRIGSSIRYDFIKVLEAIEVSKKKGAIKI